MTPGRGRTPAGAIALLAVAAAVLWASSRMTWVTITSSDGLTHPRTDHLDGGTWFGALTPLALVLLASTAAVLATRGWLRRVVGVLIAVLAAVAAVPGFALLTDSGAIAERAATLAELPARAEVAQVDTSAFSAALTILGASAALGAAVLIARMPGDTARLSGKYDNPAVRRATAAARITQQHGRATHRDASSSPSERVLWDALDAGADPTDDADGARLPEASGGAHLPPDDSDHGSAGWRGR
ncbi:TIGR02234 family membrane protein [Nocardia sp. CNY236]|uniref:TIGR02234 family membrane protein n=1 Tax=Nocardia sp. CNY236 TaxID=1169152 RepID=UPI000422F889|nr:TIGR02234 family membrane protein [Nocardia sp. CNY236]